MKRYSEEEKTMWLEDWRRGGKGAWAYAKANGLNPQTFSKWAKEPKQATAQNFIEIKPIPEGPPSPAPEILIEKGDIKIHIPITINRSDLKSVIQSLGCEL
jgi:transposase-like protein